MQVQGVVIAVSLDTNIKKKDGGTYKGWELIYKSTDGETRTIAKPATSLTYNASLKKALADLMQGDEFTLEQEKNAAGFYDIKSIVKGFSEVSTNASVSQGQAPVNGSQKSPQAVSNYETRDERNARQRLIVRQSSLTAATSIVQAETGGKAKRDDVLSLAETLTDWVFEKGNVGLQNMESDMPE